MCRVSESVDITAPQAALGRYPRSHTALKSNVTKLYRIHCALLPHGRPVNSFSTREDGRLSWYVSELDIGREARVRW
jgi:hypothetical protein